MYQTKELFFLLPFVFFNGCMRRGLGLLVVFRRSSNFFLGRPSCSALPAYTPQSNYCFLTSSRHGSQFVARQNLSSFQMGRSKPIVVTDDDPSSHAPRRRYRPGFNSYLKVMMDQSTMNTLHNMTLEVKDWLQKQEQQQHQQPDKRHGDDNSLTIDASGKETVARLGLRLKPRSVTSLHLTLLFGGEVLGEIPPEELQLWHEQVKERLLLAGFALQQDESIDAFTSCSPSETISFDAGKYAISLEGLITFPPKRNNLIVAVFNPSPDWQVLYQDLVALTKNASYSERLRHIASRSHDKWTPHVTLGNLIGKRRGSQVNDLREHLTSISVTCKELVATIPICGISMGGPVPQQLPLSWNFVPHTDADKKTTATTLRLPHNSSQE
jgi:2'-5' RNA ligase